MTPLEFRRHLWREKTRVFKLSCGDDFKFKRFDKYTVFYDTQTDT